jgi:arylsulfatase A-like enzyme
MAVVGAKLWRPGVPAWAVATLALAALLGSAWLTGSTASGSPAHPNILIILTDDQRDQGTVDSGVMPYTKIYFNDFGKRFTDGYFTTPLCCPARASLLTGRYVHNHPIKDLNGGIVAPGQPGAVEFHAGTIENYLKNRAGYRTGLYGKFLNGWDFYDGDGDGPDTPPYFDEYSVMGNGPHTSSGTGTEPGCGSAADLGKGEACVNEQGTVKELTTYSTDYLRDQARDFLYRRESNDDQPWFLYVAPISPHGPFVPASRHENAAVPAFQPNPASFHPEYEPLTCLRDPVTHQPVESDWNSRIKLPGKPRYIYRQANSQCNMNNGQSGVKYSNHPDVQLARREAQLRMLMSVDNLVQYVMATLEDLEEDQDTLALFMSDNGMIWGEHWLIGKGKAYTDSIRVPFYLRWPNGQNGISTNRFAANIDVAPTLLQVAGVSLTSSDPKMDGSSLLDSTLLRRRLLTEFWQQNPEPNYGEKTWASIRTATYQYIESYNDYLPDGSGMTHTFKEYYDLVNDPYQLTNLYGEDGEPGNDPPTDPPAPVLSALLDHYRHCAGDTCPPKGDTIPPKGVDVQTQNGMIDPTMCPVQPVLYRPDDCDKFTYTFDKPIDPSSLVAGWDGSGSRLITASVNGDSGDPYGNPPRRNDVFEVPSIPALGKVDLGANNYVAIGPKNFPSSVLTMSADLKTITITLDNGGVQAGPYTTVSTMTWKGYDTIRDAVGNTAGVGALTVTESGSADREF